MIKIQINKTNNKYSSLIVSGHSNYDEHGKDIVCGAVSALVMNTMNSIHSFTSDVFDYNEHEKRGLVDFRIVSERSPESIVLLKSLILGLQSIQEEYGEKYLRIDFQNS